MRERYVDMYRGGEGVIRRGERESWRKMCSHADVSYIRVIKMKDMKVYIKMGREVEDKW